MRFIFLPFAALLICLPPMLRAGEAVAGPKPVRKITPGKVIIPTETMRRVWGELVSIDLAARTGVFRKEGTDELIRFTVLPYAELLHHATLGDLQDFRIGERAIFRLHPDEAGEWRWLSYIQDEMNMLHGHKEYYYVDVVDAGRGQLVCTQANFDMSFIRQSEIAIQTDAQTRYWKLGRPAKFTDIEPGDKLRTKTRGTGQGRERVAWEVFLDDESLLKFQAGQKAVQAARLLEQGAPGYVDEVHGAEVRLTLFAEGSEQWRALKAGLAVWLAPAGGDRQPTAAALPATVRAARTIGRECEVTVAVAGAVAALRPAGLARLWLAR